MDHKKPSFGNFREKKFTSSNKNCFNLSPKLKNVSPANRPEKKKLLIQKSIVPYCSPNSEIKRIVKFIIPKASSSTVKRALFLQSDEVITVEDDDKKNVEINEISKVTDHDQFIDSNPALDEACVKLLDELTYEHNTLPLNQKESLHNVCDNSRKLSDKEIANPNKQTSNTDVISTKSKNDLSFVKISPAKSNISVKEELQSIVSESSYFETKDQIQDPCCSNTFEKNMNEEKQITSYKDTKFDHQILSKKMCNLQVDVNENAICLSQEQTDCAKNKIETDLISYIINTAPALTAWKTTFSQSSHQTLYKNFMSLSSEEKYLYSRLYCRKNEWVQVENSTYDFISDSDIKVTLTNLKNIGFIQYLDPNTEDLSFLLNLLPYEEIKKYCEMISISKKGNKSSLIDNILKNIQSQTTINFDCTSPVSYLKNLIIKDFPKFIKLQDEPRKIFTSFLIISTYPYLKSRDYNIEKVFIELLTNLNNGTIQELKLPLSSVPPMFKSLAKFEKYENSLNLIDHFLQTKKKNLTQAAATVLYVKTELITFLQDEESLYELENMLDYLKEYTPLANYVHILDEGIAVLKKLKGPLQFFMESEAAECLMLLLSQNFYKRGRRAFWYYELSLLMEHWKQFDNVFFSLYLGLMEDSLTPLGNMLLSDRCELLINRNIGLSVPQKQDLLKLMNKQSYHYNNKVIKAPTTPNKQMSVKEIALQHYLTIGSEICNKGLNDKGHTLMNIVLCTFWKIIYEPLEGMFHVRFQDRPIDWGSAAFYCNRADLIKKHKERLVEIGTDGIMNEITKICINYSGTSSLVSWEVIKLKNIKDIKIILECIGTQPFLEICDYLLQLYEERSTGFPDLTLWNTKNKKLLFVVIKGSGGKLSPAEKVWLQKLNEIGLEGEVCHVNTLPEEN